MKIEIFTDDKNLGLIFDRRDSENKKQKAYNATTSLCSPQLLN